MLNRDVSQFMGGGGDIFIGGQKIGECANIDISRTQPERFFRLGEMPQIESLMDEINVTLTIMPDRDITQTMFSNMNGLFNNPSTMRIMMRDHTINLINVRFTEIRHEMSPMRDRDFITADLVCTDMEMITSLDEPMVCSDEMKELMDMIMTDYMNHHSFGGYL